MNADAEKCFDKLWFKYNLIEMERIGYNKNNIKTLYKINTTTEITKDTTTSSIESIKNRSS